MDYVIRDIDKSNSEFNLKGIRLKNGKTCVFWNNKTSRNINEAIVFMDNKDVRSISDEQICISLNGIKDINTQRAFINAFCDQLRAMGIDTKRIVFKFVISNREDELSAGNIINNLGLNGDVLGVGINNGLLDINKNKEKKNLIDEIEEQRENKQDDGVIDDEKVIDIEDDSELDVLGDKFLAEIDNSNRDVSLGYFDDKNSDDDKQDDVKIFEDKEKIRLEDKKFYVQNDKDLFDEDYNYIGSIGNDGYEINSGDMSLVKRDINSGRLVKLGYIVPEKEEDASLVNNDANGKVMVRKLKKDNFHSISGGYVNDFDDTNGSKAFISLPVIIFIISFLLLVGSGIIWFMTK